MKRIKNKLIVSILTLTIMIVALFPAVNAGLSIASKDTSVNLTTSNDSKLSDNNLNNNQDSNNNQISDDTLSNNKLSNANNNGIGNDSLSNGQISDDISSGYTEKLNKTTDELMGTIEGELETKAKIGTFWWYRGDGGLIYAQGDANGFANTLADDGCIWSINKNSEDNELYDYYIQDGPNELVDNVDIAYFVGHGGKTVLGIYKPFKYTIWDNPSVVESLLCKWGDDGPNKWVVLATCFAAHGGLLGFQRALKGTNMILGWDTICSDALYGQVFANKIIEGMKLKEAWFETADECEHVHARAKILGEDVSVGNDYLKGYGSYANPEVDLLYTWWTHEVKGWQENYDWVSPDNHNNLWENPSLSYDNHDPDYANDPLYKADTYSIFRNINSDNPDWTEPLVLTLDEPTTIRGFRIIANKYATYNSGTHVEEPVFDKMKLSFYEDGNDQPVTTVILDNWESRAWRIIDFEEGGIYQAQATIVGERTPTVTSVKIEVHKITSKSFDEYPVRISEFDFWSVSTPDIPTQNMGYNIVPQQYNEEFFGSIASRMDINGDVEYNDSQGTYKVEDYEKSLKYETKTGILSYINPSKAYPTAFSKPMIPNDADVEAIAKNLLIECGIPANEVKTTLITYDTQGCGNKITGVTLYEWIITKTVYLKRQINDVALPGTIKVTIGENGDIASFKIPMQTLEQTTNQNQNTQNVQNAGMNNQLINRLHTRLISLISSIKFNTSSISSKFN
ncbi:MAG: DUF6345 domain-containing protein [Thermoplasmatota archaeon]